ncbi:nonstructural protein 1 [Parvoviridae sp.]|uniref:Nonstructural protein 1 n=1 Tax=Grus japonensis parvovirus 4 TaxID=3071219 RepID=A0A2K9YNA5_9VIRU|nr:nonstructural protein 1 [Parvoviridae sp.]AUW34321.1 nonstructural protein 1 [Grus japonensis parvovirus 4]
MASPGPDNGHFYLWHGRTGTGCDLSRNQAETLLVERTLQPRDFEQVEYDLKLLNMQQQLCGIFQCSTALYNPCTDPLLYAMLFSDLTTVTKWAATAEFNKDGIFHVHCIFKTAVRPDSLRRTINTIWPKLTNSVTFLHKWGADGTVECLKLQRAHKPEGMMQYMMKGPSWICSNDEHYLQCLSDIANHGLHERFKAPKEPDNEPPQMNPMADEITSVIIAHHCRTLEDCIKAAPAIMGKYLHKPGFSSIVQNCITFVHATAGNFGLQRFEKFEPDPEQIHMILLHQGVNPTQFDQLFHSWITKKHPKRNTICLIGPSNTGKSAFIAGLKENVPWGEIINSNNFAFEGLQNGFIGVWEEPLCSAELAEKTKQITEGMPTMIPIKFRKPVKLERTPIIITTNHDLWRFCSSEEEAFRNRMWIIPWEAPVQNTFYYPRTSNNGCKCRYCRASCGSTETDGSGSTSGLQSTEQSISTTESLRTDITTTMGSGSMPESREGICGSITSTDTNIQQTESSGYRIESSTTIDQYFTTRTRTNRSSNTMHRANSPQPSTSYAMESELNRRRDESNMGSNAETNTTIITRKRTFSTMPEHARDHTYTTSTPSIMVSRQTTSKKSKIRVQTKKQRVDQSLGAKVGAIKLDLHVPSKSNWQDYLSWLYHIYGP